MLLASLADARIKPDSKPIPRNTRSMTVEGVSHEEHTSDRWGRFMHPFKNADEAVQSISYPESKTYSTKLHRK